MDEIDVEGDLTQVDARAPESDGVLHDRDLSAHVDDQRLDVATRTPMCVGVMHEQVDVPAQAMREVAPGQRRAAGEMARLARLEAAQQGDDGLGDHAAIEVAQHPSVPRDGGQVASSPSR